MKSTLNQIVNTSERDMYHAHYKNIRTYIVGRTKSGAQADDTTR